jgi:hypothetical protein
VDFLPSAALDHTPWQATAPCGAASSSTPDTIKACPPLASTVHADRRDACTHSPQESDGTVVIAAMALNLARRHRALTFAGVRYTVSRRVATSGGVALL